CRSFPTRRSSDLSSGLTFNERIEYNAFGRVQGGTRVDGKVFTLEAAQMLAVVDISEGEALDPTDPYKTVRLSVRDADSEQHFATARYTSFQEREVTYTMTGFGQFQASRDEDDLTEVTYERDERGLVQTTTNPLGHKVEMVYDDFGNMIRRTDYPNGGAVTSTWEYDLRWSIVIEHVDGTGRRTTYTPDDRGNIISTTITAPTGTPASVTLFSSYDSRGL